MSKRLMGLVESGRFVGVCQTAERTGRNIEYGWRGPDGVLHVEGIARVEPLSSIKGAPARQEIMADRDSYRIFVG